MELKIRIDQLDKPRIKDPKMRQKVLVLHNERSSELQKNKYLDYVDGNVNFGIMSINEYNELLNKCKKISKI